MNISGSTALVTGTNRGLGKALVEALREGGARRIYAATRKPDGVTSDAVVQPIMLDITNAAHVEAAAAKCGDVDILINNAGIANFTAALAAPSMENARREMDTNYFGTLAMCLRPHTQTQRRRRAGQHAVGGQLLQRTDAGNLQCIESRRVVPHQGGAI